MSTVPTYLYTVDMPQLTEEQLAKIYPQAKSYDEIRVARDARNEQRRPKFVATKVAFWTTLCVPTIIVTYYFIRLFFSGATQGGTMGALAGICFGLLVGITGIASIYYLWHLVDKIASKTILATQTLYLLLSGFVVAATAANLYAHQYVVGILISTTSLSSLVVFGLTYWLTNLALKKR